MASLTESRITRWLSRTNAFSFALYATVMAFCLYTCVYAFRKTFSVATFDGISYWGITYKVWLVTFQVIGYALSKFVGIKIISELKAKSRAGGILLMVTIAGISWLLFGLVPKPYNILFLFTNGFPLGMVWGMVFGYLEGRRYTEVLGAGLSVSFIFSAGFAKSVGGFIMRDWGTSETWMPLVTSLLFLGPLLVFLWLLDKLPPPSAEDEALRTRRQPMNAAERKRFVSNFWPGIVLFTLAYMFLTAFRDFRDNFSAEVWNTLGYGDSPEIFTTTEIPVSIAVLIVMGSLMMIRNNKLALLINHIIIFIGMVLIGVSTFLFEQHIISPPAWMILIGLGLYLGYVPFNSIFFDRLLAAFKYVGTVGFIMYVADSFGYLASVGVMLFKEFGYAELSWLQFFVSGGYVISLIGSVLIAASMLYFHNKSTDIAAGETTVLPSPQQV
jgi:MFS family permease